MIEFGLAFMVIFPVFAGCFELGYGFFQYNKLETAVRAGARYAALRDYNSSTSTPAASYLLSVRNTVLYGDPNGGAIPVVPGLRPQNIDVVVNMVNGVPRAVTVGVVNYQLDAVVKTITLNQKPQVMFRYVGRMSAP